MDALAERITAVKQRIAEACRAAGRDPSEVRLVAVTKTVSADVIRAGVEAGLEVLGENYVQEAQAKIEAVGRKAEWHFIGRLQTNKAKYAARLFDMIHSMDSLKLAVELNKRAGIEDRVLPVLLQVNVSGEETKGGSDVEDAAALLDEVRKLDRLELRGLMTMPPFFDDPGRARPHFETLRNIRDRYAPDLPELSMGMSGDFEAAIAEGSTLVRIGTAVFGPRNY